MRVRKFKIGAQVKLNRLAVLQNENTPEQDMFHQLSMHNTIEEVIHLEENLPNNSNFRYAVQFGEYTIIVNENQIEPA